MTHQVVFNLRPFNDSLYLPTAHIVQVDARGLLTYPVKRAIPATLASYGIETTPVIARLLDIVGLLSPEALEKKYKPTRAGIAPTLAALLSGTDTRPVVEKFIFGHLDTFLTEISTHALPLTLHVENKTLAKDVQMTFSHQEHFPRLFFKKTPAGIEYRLRIGTEETTLNIRERDVLPLTNTDPAWLLAGYELLRVAGINGNMVKPFRQKDTVLIPPEQERVYFQKFIAKSIRRSTVEAEGFRVEKTETLLGTRLEAVENLLDKRWRLRPVFEYGTAGFAFGDRRDRVTALDIPKAEDGEITVRLVCRDGKTERERLAFLRSLGLEEDGVLFWPDPDAADSLAAVLHFLARHRTTLEEAGFSIAAPQSEGRTLALGAGTVALRYEAAGDWFDVHCQVTAGAYTFPFRRLLPHLRKRDPFFLLPDGTFFYIPEEWFARYGDLAGALNDKGETLRLPKTLYTILQQLHLSPPPGAAGETAPAGLEGAFPEIDPENIDFTPSENLKASLRPYQLAGVKWLIGHYRNGFGACLADDMGLGKTLQTIAALLHAKEQGREQAPETAASRQLDMFAAHREALRPLNALVILPASLVFNWKRELEKFAPLLFVHVLTGPNRLRDARALAGFDVVLTTYHTARQDLKLLEKIGWQFIVLDESQQIKNRDSEISRVVRGLQGRHKISLSGTPIENSLADLWTQMEFINPDTLGSYQSFREQFQTPIEKHGDERAKARLFSRVKPYFLRRTKEEVAPDLPELTEQVFYSEMDEAQRKRYERVKSAARNEILSLFNDPKTRLMALQALTRLRQLANHPVLAEADYDGASGKMDDVLAQWDTARRAGHKVLFFSSFEKHLQLFRHHLEAEGQPFAWLTGEVAAPARAREVERFQQDPGVQAFLMTLGAGGVGLNLTAADYVFLLDPWWNPAKEQQAIARAHRIGRQHPVTAIRFIARDTIEEKIVQLQEHKRRLGEGLFAGGAEYPDLDREDMEMLLG